MRILSFNYSQSVCDAVGAGPSPFAPDSAIRLDRLGSVVALAGPNGAGKSRLLRLIRSMASLSVNEDRRKRLENALNMACHARDVARKKSPPPAADAQAVSQHKHRISALESELINLEREWLKATCITWAHHEQGAPLFYVPKNAELLDPADKKEKDAIQAASAMHVLSPSHSGYDAAAYARRLLRGGLQARDTATRSKAEVSSRLNASEFSLKKLARELLGEDFNLELDSDLQLVIGGRRDYPTALSDGQKMLFKLACQLHAHTDSLKGQVLMLDEPENYLHPAALVGVVDRLKELLADGQLWIATHSVPLVAHLVGQDPDCLWYATQGVFRNAGRRPELVLESLLGGPTGVERLREFTRLPAQFALERFLAECLKPPAVAAPNVADPQTNQVASLLHAMPRQAGSQCPIRVLDFGAGKGRLLATLRAIDAPALEEWLDYLAFDPSDEHQQACGLEIAEAYPQPAKQQNRWFSDRHKLGARIDDSSVDAVVLCNVLHEIEPLQWTELFGSSGWLTRKLSPTGAILVVEDYEMPTGEQAHEHGFLLLDEEELAQLFCITEVDRRAGLFRSESAAQQKYGSRLKAHLIGKQLVERMSPESRVAAIRELQGRMKARMKQLAGAPASSGQAGRHYALAAQLFANATLALEALGA